MILRLIAVACVLLTGTLASAQGDVAPTVATAEALVAAVAAGGVVWVEPGDYVIAQTLVIGRDVELRGVEPSAASLYLQGAPEGMRIENGAHAQLTGVRLAYDADAPGDTVRVDDARLTLDGVAVGFAVAVPGAYQVDAEGYGRGLYLTGDAEVEVLGGGFGDNEGAAVFLQDAARLHVSGAFEIAGAARVTLVDPTIEATGTWAHTYVVGNATLTVEGGRFADNDGALYVGDGARASLENVVMAGGAAEAVYVDDSAFVVVRGGRIEDHADFGVLASGSGRVHVEGVHVAGNRSGLVATGASTMIARDNDVVDQERTGIAFLDVAAGDAIGNRVRGSGWTGVVVAGEAVATVAGNALEANVQRGAWFDEAGAGTFEGNTVRGSPIGLEIASGAAPVVGANTFEDVATELVEAE